MRTHLFVLPATFALLVVFSACGEVTIPDDTTANDTIVVGQDTNTADQANPNSDAMQQDAGAMENQNSSAELAACLKEKENLSEALEINADALKTCQEARQNTASTTNGSTPVPTVAASGNLEKYQKFVDFYLANAQLREFPFPKCGNLNTFATDAWFAEFKSALTNLQIPFGRRIVEAADLSGGCFSTEGQMAFFLGAESEGLFECHVIKYDLANKTVEDAFFAEGSYDVCPTVLGKRQGGYLTLLGQKDGQEIVYKYFYDANILSR